MSNYDSFAKFYDTIMGDRSDVINLIFHEILQHASSAKTILELGAGTGSIIYGLSEKYKVAGLEKSRNMLNIAQHKLPNSHLVQGDISDFELGETYDVIFCVFDTINHLSSLSEWDTMFAATVRHLNDPGLFIFDMITLHRLQLLMVMPTYSLAEQLLTAEIEIDHLSSNQVEWTTTVQETGADGAIQVYVDHAIETSFKLTDVYGILGKYFTILDTYDASFKPASEKSDRIYFICRPNFDK
jgi:predicted TPR repeat methyltransferase